MFPLQTVKQRFLDILLSENSLIDIRFYENYNADRLSVPLRGIIACISISKCELEQATAAGLVKQDKNGYLGSFKTEISVYTNTSAGGEKCIDAMSRVADALLKRADELDMGLSRLSIVPVEFVSNMHAFKGSVIFELSAAAEQEAEDDTQ